MANKDGSTDGLLMYFLTRSPDKSDEKGHLESTSDIEYFLRATDERTDSIYIDFMVHGLSDQAQRKAFAEANDMAPFSFEQRHRRMGSPDKMKFRMPEEKAIEVMNKLAALDFSFEPVLPNYLDDFPDDGSLGDLGSSQVILADWLSLGTEARERRRSISATTEYVQEVCDRIIGQGVPQ